MIADPRAFILQHTRLQRPPHAPEIVLHLATEIEPIWRMTEDALGRAGVDPPFWAFAWAGGQGPRPLPARPSRGGARAAGGRLRHRLWHGGDRGEAGGADAVLAADIDPFCAAAVPLNAEANGVEIAFTGEDLLDAGPPSADLICAGDICYEWPLADRVRQWLQIAHRRGTRVLIGDPGRAYLPREGLELLARYQVRTTRELEDQEIRSTGVFTFAD